MFAGATHAEGGGSPGNVTVYWAPATDASTPQNKIVYEVFAQSGSAPTSFEYPYVTGPGATSFSTDNYGWDDQVYFIVRARNRAGVRDENTIAVSAQPAADTNPPYFDGLVLGARLTSTTGAVAWSPANDDDPYNSWIDIQIDVWLATTPTGHVFSDAPIASAYNNESVITLSGLNPSVTYYAVGRARDMYGNREANTVAVTIPKIDNPAPPTPPPDPPPVLEYVAPLPGMTIGRKQPVRFRVTDNLAMRRLIVIASIPTVSADEVVFDGQLRRLYAGSSSAVPIEGGYELTVLRAGGWPGSPTFRVFAIDSKGSEA